jgi:hypothetical protein
MCLRRSPLVSIDGACAKTPRERFGSAVELKSPLTAIQDRPAAAHRTADAMRRSRPMAIEGALLAAVPVAVFARPPGR